MGADCGRLNIVKVGEQFVNNVNIIIILYATSYFITLRPQIATTLRGALRGGVRQLARPTELVVLSKKSWDVCTCVYTPIALI